MVYHTPPSHCYDNSSSDGVVVLMVWYSPSLSTQHHGCWNNWYIVSGLLPFVSGTKNTTNSNPANVNAANIVYTYVIWKGGGGKFIILIITSGGDEGLKWKHFSSVILYLTSILLCCNHCANSFSIELQEGFKRWKIFQKSEWIQRYWISEIVDWGTLYF